MLVFGADFLGAAAAISPTGLTVAPALIHFDLPVMLAATVACLPIFATHTSESVELMHNAMLSFVVPLTFITLALLCLREIRSNRRRQCSAIHPKARTHQ